jgi:hypothetical protein
MKRTIDIFLVLILLGAAGYVVFAGDGGTDISPTLAAAAPASFAAVLPIDTLAPTEVATATLIPASVTIPTMTFTPTPTRTVAPTRTPTETPSPTASITPTSDPTQSFVDQEVSSGIDRGNQIIKAIEAYHSAQGQYPSMLGDLVPLYIAAIPSTANGRPYFYRLFDTTGPMASEVYWLAFRVESQDHLTCTYFRRLDYWDCNLESP